MALQKLYIILGKHFHGCKARAKFAWDDRVLQMSPERSSTADAQIMQSKAIIALRHFPKSFFFLFSKSRDKLSYHICHSPLFVVVDQLTLLPTSYCPLHWCICMGHNTISVLAWLAWMHSPNLQSPISMHAKYKPQDFTDVIIIWKLHCIAWKIGPNKVIDWCGSIFCYDKLGW